MISKEQIDALVNQIVEKIHPEKIILFGSYAYGNPKSHSDLDLLIVKEMDLPKYKRGREIRKHIRNFKFPIDLIVYRNNEIEKWKNIDSAFITSIVKKGKVIYG